MAFENTQRAPDNSMLDIQNRIREADRHYNPIDTTKEIPRTVSPKPDAPMWDAAPAKPAPSSGIPRVASYLPSSTDLAAFEKESGIFQRSYSRADLETMRNSPNSGVRKMVDYLNKNFNTVRDLTSGGNQNRIGIDDIRLLVDLGDAARDVATLAEGGVAKALASFNTWDTNGNGRLEQTELTRALKGKQPDETQAIQAIDRNFDVLRKTSKDGFFADMSISRKDLTDFQASVALDSVMRETHLKHDLGSRVFAARYVGEVLGGAAMLYFGDDDVSIPKVIVASKIAGEVTTRIAGYAVRSYAVRHYDEAASPAIKNLVFQSKT